MPGRINLSETESGGRNSKFIIKANRSAAHRRGRVSRPKAFPCEGNGINFALSAKLHFCVSNSKTIIASGDPEIILISGGRVKTLPYSIYETSSGGASKAPPPTVARLINAGRGVYIILHFEFCILNSLAYLPLWVYNKAYNKHEKHLWESNLN